MNMKFKFLAAITMAMGLFSCSNDEGLDNTTPGGQGILGNAETYATIRIAMPGGADAMGRALTKTDPENGDGSEIGTDNENNFHDIALYFFDGHEKTSTCKGVLTINSKDFTKQSNEEKNVVYTTTNPIKVGIEGTGMKVYAVMNGSVSGANAGINLETFLEKTVKTDAVFNESKNKFLMTSRTPGELSISSKLNSTAETAAQLEVSVERTAAKITYKAENITQGQENQYEVNKEGTSDVAATVTLTGYKLVNLRNDAYYFRKVAGADGNWKTDNTFGNGDQTGNNFVIDPYFTAKTVEAASKDNFYTEWFGSDQEYAVNSQEYKNLPTEAEHQLLDYCMENTTTQDAQLNGYSTGIIFQATYAPKEVYVLNKGKNDFETTSYTSGENFYSYANVLYKNKQDIIDFYEITENSELIKEYIGDGNKGATCYYKYWIRHMNNNNNEQMGPMEFAIVRNNVYKLSVSKVNDLGDPTGEIDPNNPDETSKMYLSVKVSILPWVVRKNEGIEL